jgi:hypothetical protein
MDRPQSDSRGHSPQLGEVGACNQRAYVNMSGIILDTGRQFQFRGHHTDLGLHLGVGIKFRQHDPGGIWT